LAARSLSAALAAVLLLAGCGSGEERLDSGTSGLAKGESWEELRQQAAATLAQYDEKADRFQPPRVFHVNPSKPDPSGRLSGVLFSAVPLNAAGTRLKITFMGESGPPAAQPCGVDYAAEAVESDKAVAVIILEQRNGSGICAGVGMSRTATLNLAEPLGDRGIFPVQG
jgi:hypothetical protein